MRLLHTKDLRFQEFFDEEIPRYAILSHRWGPDEVSYQDFITGVKKDSAGYKKVLECCTYTATDPYMHDGLFESKPGGLRPPANEWHESWASGWVWVERGYDWVWVDTCCIDKSSSAELSEAINSMFTWYDRAAVCYAYLSDITSRSVTGIETSQWWNRGWTLQELLAPVEVVFLNKAWLDLGHRRDIKAHIATITHIPEEYLTGKTLQLQHGTRAAQKLLWAAKRRTTRIEDQAYCLLGLFDVNMPLLYGEGDKAFSRLQRKILKTTNDESVFVWDSSHNFFSRGILARDITEFGVGERPAVSFRDFRIIHELARPPYTITNHGLQLRVPRELAMKQGFLFPLNCKHYSGDEIKGAYAIHLTRDSSNMAWGRRFTSKWPKYLPPPDADVYRLQNSLCLFIVPLDWVWSREDLAMRDSEIIYVSLY